MIEQDCRLCHSMVDRMELIQFMSYSMMMMSMRTFHQFRCCSNYYRDLAVVPIYVQLHHQKQMPTLTDRLDSMKRNSHYECDRLVWLTVLRVLCAKYTPEWCERNKYGFLKETNSNWRRNEIKSIWTLPCDLHCR